MNQQQLRHFIDLVQLSILIIENKHVVAKQTVSSQSKSCSNPPNGVHRVPAHNHPQNGDYHVSKPIMEIRNQSSYGSIDNSYKLRTEMNNKIDKVRNQDIMEYEDHFSKLMQGDQDYQMQQYQVQSWFDISQVSIVEKQAIPEFFDNSKKSKTPELYRKYRNYMVLLYQESPRKYINFTTIRRNLAGDVNGLLKIYKQLQKWGLINYSCNPIYNYQGQEKQSTMEQFNRVASRLDANSLRTKTDYKYEIDMLNQNVKYLNYKYRVYCQFCEQFCNSLYYQNKQSNSNLNQLCVECYCYLSRNKRISNQDYNKTDIIQKQIQQNDDNQQNKHFNANDSQKIIELMNDKLDDDQLMEQVNPSKKKDEYLIHLLQLPFKNESYQKVVDDQLDYNGQMKWLEANSKMYFQNLRDQKIKLMDYVYEMIDQINLFNKALESVDMEAQKQDQEQQTRGNNGRLEQLLDQCLKIANTFHKDQKRLVQEDVQTVQLMKFVNYIWSIRLYVLNRKQELTDQDKREFIVKFLQYSQIYLMKLKQQDYEVTEKMIRKEMNNLQVYRKQQIKQKVENQVEMNQRRTDIETGNKIYIKLGNNETLLANHSYIY